MVKYRRGDFLLTKWHSTSCRPKHTARSECSACGKLCEIMSNPCSEAGKCRQHNKSWRWFGLDFSDLLEHVRRPAVHSTVVRNAIRCVKIGD